MKAGYLPHLDPGTGLKESQYQSIVGVLLYIVRMTHPEALFGVTYLSRFIREHNQSHIQASIDMMLYLKKHAKCGIHLSADLTRRPLELFVDASFRPDKGDPKLRSYCGWILYLYGVPIITNCHSIKRVNHSSTHAEIIALFLACRDVRVVIETIRELNIGVPELSSAYIKVLVREDNKSCLKAILNPLRTPETRDLSPEIIAIREGVEMGIFTIDEVYSWVESGNNDSDIMTKPLGRPSFQKHAGRIIKTTDQNAPAWLKTITLRPCDRDALGE